MLSPDRRQLRARIAATGRHNPDHPELPAMRRDLRALAAEEYIQRLVDTAPPLTDEQRNRLAILLRPSREGTAA